MYLFFQLQDGYDTSSDEDSDSSQSTDDGTKWSERLRDETEAEYATEWGTYESGKHTVSSEIFVSHVYYKYVHNQLLNLTQPLFTARVAKRAKVMFSQACVTSTPGGGGGEVGNTKGLPPPSP